MTSETTAPTPPAIATSAPTAAELLARLQKRLSPGAATTLGAKTTAELVEELRQAIDLIRSLAGEIAYFRDRLEVNQLDYMDGIEARDVAIVLRDERAARLEARLSAAEEENKRLREGLGEIAEMRCNAGRSTSPIDELLSLIEGMKSEARSLLSGRES